MKLMKWFYDLKIGAKLVAGFIIILALVVFMAVAGNQTTSILSKYAEDVSTQWLPSLHSLHTIKEAQLAISVSGWNLTQKNYSKAQRLKEYNAIKSSLKQAEDARQQYKKLLETQPIKATELWRKFDSQWGAWKNANSQIIKLAQDADNIPATNVVGPNQPPGETTVAPQDTGVSSFYSAQATLDQLIALNLEKVTQAYKKVVIPNRNASNIINELLIFALLMAIIIGFFFRNTITKPLTRVVAVIREMSRGHLNQRLNLKRKDEIGVLAETIDDFTDDLRDNVVNPILKIAAGDLSYEVKPRDEHDEIGHALKQTINALRGLVNEANSLSQAAIAGELDQRGDSERFNGVYKDIIDGVNQTLTAINEPIQEASQILQEVARGI